MEMERFANSNFRSFFVICTIYFISRFKMIEYFVNQYKQTAFIEDVFNVTRRNQNVVKTAIYWITPCFTSSYIF